MFVEEMIEQHLIGKSDFEFTEDLKDKLVKILYQIPDPTHSALIEYVSENMDKKSLEYLDICMLKNEIKDTRIISKLELTIRLDLQTQATHFLNLMIENEGCDLQELCQRMSFDDGDEV